MSHRGVVVVLAVCLALVAVPVSAHAAVDPPPGGPILVVTSSADPFTSYYTEILRAEGLNEFSTADVSALSAQTLDAYSVVVLGARGLSGAQASCCPTGCRPAAISSPCAPTRRSRASWASPPPGEL